MNPDQIRNAIAEKVSETVQVAIGTIMSRGSDAADAVNLGCNTALCSLIPILPFLSGQDFRSEEDVMQAMNHETLLFAALIVVRMHGDLKIVSKNFKAPDGRQGLAMEQEVQFGPAIMNEALRDWKALTNKDPAKYFKKSLLDLLARAESESTAPFDEFMKKRINGPTSSTLN